jgi:hypothetical protein
LNNFDTLNIPTAPLKLQQKNGKAYVLDGIRKKWLLLTPEEWVRQHMVYYLIASKNYPASLFSLESGLKYNGLRKRSDIVVYGLQGKPVLLIECKSTAIAITQEVIEQVSVYNSSIQAVYLCVTNGLKHYCWSRNSSTDEFQFHNEIPDFKEISINLTGV